MFVHKQRFYINILLENFNSKGGSKMKKLVKRLDLNNLNTIEAYCCCYCICQTCSCWGPDFLAVSNNRSSNQQANYPDYQSK